MYFLDVIVCRLVSVNVLNYRICIVYIFFLVCCHSLKVTPDMKEIPAALIQSLLESLQRSGIADNHDNKMIRADPFEAFCTP